MAKFGRQIMASEQKPIFDSAMSEGDQITEADVQFFNAALAWLGLPEVHLTTENWRQVLLALRPEQLWELECALEGPIKADGDIDFGQLGPDWQPKDERQRGFG